MTHLLFNTFFYAGFFLLFSSAVVMTTGMGTYVMKFWGNSVAKAMKEDRLPSASKLIYAGAAMAITSVVFIAIAVIVFPRPR